MSETKREPARTPSTDEVLGPDDVRLDHLCQTLAGSAGLWRTTQDWPAASLRELARAGVYRWFVPPTEGGWGWNETDLTRGYLQLASADLTTTFIVTQFVGALRRIAGSRNAAAAKRWLDELLTGESLATVGISHLTTSRQHLGAPVMRVSQGSVAGEYRMTGVAPWVTGAIHADVIVVAGTLDDGRELLAALPTDHPAMTRGPGVQLVALSASCTDQVTLEDYPVTADLVIAGPQKEVMRSGVGAGTGGLQTSTLAVGLARAAVRYLIREGERREELAMIAASLALEVDLLQERLLGAASGAGGDPHAIRGEANRLVLRATQAALVAAKGAGFVDDHPVGRWCREALFFLVWSCPHPVASGQLCELAGLDPNFRP